MCAYSARGDGMKRHFETHKKSDMHELTQQMSILWEHQIPNVADYARNWLERSLHIGLISKEHYDKNKSSQRHSTEDPAPPSPEFQALSPAPTSPLDFSSHPPHTIDHQRCPVVLAVFTHNYHHINHNHQHMHLLFLNRQWHRPAQLPALPMDKMYLASSMDYSRLKQLSQLSVLQPITLCHIIHPHRVNQCFPHLEQFRSQVQTFMPHCLTEQTTTDDF